MPRSTRPVEDRFWSRVDRRAEDECWPWTGALNDSGYGVLWVAGSTFARAHRFALELHLGRPLDPTLVARHTCDNRVCVNAAAHLIEGTQEQNVQDMIERGRRVLPLGSMNGRARLDEDQVRYIRQRHAASEEATIAALAAELGVSVSTIRRVIRGTTWGHVSHKEGSRQ